MALLIPGAGLVDDTSALLIPGAGLVQASSTSVTITPTGKSSDEAFGSFSLKARRIVLPSAKASDEAFGTPTITVSGALPVLSAATVINITTTTATPRVTITIS